MTKLTVHTSQSYDIIVGAGLLEQAGKLIREVNDGQRVLIVTDSNIAPLYLKLIIKLLNAVGYQTSVYIFTAGEKSKRLDTISEIYGRLAASGFTRSDLLVALGGGVTGDMTGFAAATWLRGIDFVQIPTSLLAQVDSSVGGKTGVDIPEGKNLVGAFWQPIRVIVDTNTLSTLPAAFVADGLAEVVKYACICDAKLFAILESKNALQDAKREQIIARCIDIKRDIVERDERETGERKLLNFGHTLGHALEKYYQYTGLTHGFAVAVGMVKITQASEKQGMTVKGTTKRLITLLEQLGLPICDPALLSDYLPSVTMDKKCSGSHIDLVIMHDIGDTFIHRLPIGELNAFFGCATM